MQKPNYVINVFSAFDEENDMIEWRYEVMLDGELIAFNGGYPTEERAREDAKTWE